MRISRNLSTFISSSISQTHKMSFEICFSVSFWCFLNSHKSDSNSPHHLFSQYTTMKKITFIIKTFLLNKFRQSYWNEWPSNFRNQRMEFRSIWKTQLVKLQLHTPVYSLCFKPDQSQLIAACSNDLFFISPTTGKILEKKRSHTAPVYCVRCSADGTFFASSSSDGTVVIWRSLNNDGFVTYGSPSATRDLVWCPTKQLLISCSANEYNMWRPDDVRASQTTVKNPIESLAFAPNGEAFIISYSNGTVNVLSTEEQTVLQTFNY